MQMVAPQVLDPQSAPFRRTPDHAYAFDHRDAHAIIGIEAALRDLESRSAEPNPLGGTDFIIAACRHFAESLTPAFLTVTDPIGHLVAVVPLSSPRLDFTGTILRTWQHPFSSWGTPMIDAAQVDQVCHAILTYLATSSRSSAIYLGNLQAEGAVARSMAKSANDLSLEVTAFQTHERAALFIPPATASQSGDSKGRRRQRRRLSEKGSVAFDVIEDYSGLRASLETFLALEARGWKGRRGTALLQDPSHVNFIRALTWSLAEQQKVQIAELRLDNHVIASTIIFWSGNNACLWKIAYDEDYAAFSPGAHLVLDLRNWLNLRKNPAFVDSCASPGHWMIERLWPDRIAICDLMIALDQSRLPAYRASVLREKIRRNLRARIKTVYNRLRQFQTSRPFAQ